MNQSAKIELYIDGPDHKVVLAAYQAVEKILNKETNRLLKDKQVKATNTLFTTSMGGVIEGKRNPFWNQHPKAKEQAKA